MHTSELTAEFLVRAYASGYFPMPHPESNEVLWFNPDPRAIIPLEQFHASRSLRQSVRRSGWRVSINENFAGVMQACGERDDTWINQDFVRVYGELHRASLAHSLEVWSGAQLVGGIYGVSLGGAFFAESKFHRQRDASKAALWFLIQQMQACQMTLLEVQFITPHLETLGATAIAASEYAKRLTSALNSAHIFQPTLKVSGAAEKSEPK